MQPVGISANMNTITSQPYQAPPVSRPEFAENQKASTPSDKATASSKPPEEAKQQPEAKQPTEAKQRAEEQREQQELQQLKIRDKEVRAHEAAHVAAGGSLVRGGVHFNFKRGSDGINYAVGGDVSIDISKSSDPKENLRKAETIQRAALAPANPSAQDHAVAAQATKMATMAQAEIAQLSQSERSEGTTAEPAEAKDTSDKTAQTSGADRYQEFEKMADSSSSTSSLNEFA